MTFSAGLAAAGMVPFCNIYSTAMQRAYDNVIQRRHSGPSGGDVSTGAVWSAGRRDARGVFDMAAFGCVPTLAIAAPMDELELRGMMYAGLQYGHPFMIRYPAAAAKAGCGAVRGSNPPVGGDTSSATERMWRCDRRDGRQRRRTRRRTRRRRRVSAAHYDLRAKPLDELLLEVGAKFRRVVTVEDGACAERRRSRRGIFNARGLVWCVRWASA
ncbi:MAG: hypothetical protein ACLRMJ_04010 [Alistipes finegoldii]